MLQRVKDYLRPVRSSLRLAADKRSNRSWIPKVRPPSAPDKHLSGAVDWLCRAQDFGSDRGVSYGVAMGHGFLGSYPETTGYIIPTFLRLAGLLNRPDLIQRATESGDWEIDVQMKSGAVMGGRVNPTPSPAVFNTGQVLLGWASLLKQTGEERYETAGRKAADWMLEMQEPDGNWIRGNSAFAKEGSTLYNVRAAWGLALFGAVTGDNSYVDAAVRNAEYTLTRQRPNGWYAENCLTDPDKPLTHTIAYTARGLFEIGSLAGRDDFIQSTRRCVDGLVGVIGSDGFLPGRIDADWKGAVRWCCLTGNAQTAVVLHRLARRFGEDGYREKAKLLTSYVASRQDLEHPRPEIRGGVSGSWPVEGDYGRFYVLNWAVKFFADALIEEIADERRFDEDPLIQG